MAEMRGNLFIDLINVFLFNMGRYIFFKIFYLLN